MRELLTLFYRLPMGLIALSFLIAGLLFLELRTRLSSRLWFRRGLALLLALWFCVMLYATVLDRSSGRVYLPELIPFHSYRKMLATGNDEIFRTNFMNVALFYPAGLLTAALLPARRGPRRHLLTVMLIFLLLSIAIEYVQFRWTLGEPEIDDVLHNTLGAALGALPIVLEPLLPKRQ